MENRKKYCRYCGKVFYAKRIDAQYCSPSCRNMGYRAKYNMNYHSNSMGVSFTLKPKEYVLLVNEGANAGLTADEFAQKLCLQFIHKKEN